LQTIYTDEIWNDVLSFDNISDAVECFTVVLEELIELLMPLDRVHIKQNTSSLAVDSEVIAAHRRRDKAYHQALKIGDLLVWQEYRSERLIFVSAHISSVSKMLPHAVSLASKWSGFETTVSSGIHNMRFHPGTSAFHSLCK